MQRFLFAVCFALMACLLTRCQVNGAFDPGQGTGEFSAPTTTTSNYDCSQGSAKACDACTSALDCAGAGSLCLSVSATTDGTCAPACRHDCDCPTDFACTAVGKTNPVNVCQPKGGICAPTCTCNQDCTAPNTACDGHYCRTVCTTTADCASTPDFVCTDLEVCAPPPTPGVQCGGAE